MNINMPRPVVLANSRFISPFIHQLPRSVSISRHDRYSSTNAGVQKQEDTQQKAIRHRWDSPSASVAQRDFFFDVLNVSATRRDAKQYLSRFEKKPKSTQKLDRPTLQAPGSGTNHYAQGINLGELYHPTTAVETSPVFRQAETPEETDQTAQINAALVSIRFPELISDSDLDGVALTLSQLVRLGMRIAVTFDCEARGWPIQTVKRTLERQASRLSRALSYHNAAGARYVEGALQVLPSGQPGRNSTETSRLTVTLPSMLFEPIKNDCIPVVPCLAYTDSCQAIVVHQPEVLAALTDCLIGRNQAGVLDKHQTPVLSMDRIIIIDRNGGIPSSDREDGSHVFVNMKQEYEDIASDLRSGPGSSSAARIQHLENLTALKNCLEILPPTSSALVISPEEAASSSRPTGNDGGPASIRTRRQKNPLIHNLLTNRPVISSSLPAARVSAKGEKRGSTLNGPVRSTLVKLGMPLSMIPDPRRHPWIPPISGKTDISLDHHDQIDSPRLFNLIDDSFRRPIDLPAYLKRVKGHVAGVIVAGEYEGGAILTWESPPGSDNDPARLVPYLDKFAVLQKAQGNAGVADIVFQSMVRSCFPHGVCWRSRSANPVNKWYFERSVGTWKLPGGHWTMFWTTPSEDLILDEQKWKDYVAVCQNVQPTWADGKKAD